MARRAAAPVAVCIASIFVGAYLAACGSGGATDTTTAGSASAAKSGERHAQPSTSRAFDEVAVDLRRAALSKRPYAAIHRTEGLKAAERGTLESFCKVNRQLVENQESWKLRQISYYIARIRNYAEASLAFYATPGVNAAIGTLQDALDLRSFGAEQVRLYARACYR